jgi:hypothetical protein
LFGQQEVLFCWNEKQDVFIKTNIFSKPVQKKENEKFTIVGFFLTK